jgi:prepilin-type N-terminal cleavage/methylation domain-containing protein
MLKGKSTKGLTLAELLIATAILAAVTLAATVLFFTAIESHARDLRLMEDQYNAQMALLSIVRETRYGVSASVTGNELTLITQDGSELKYSLNAAGKLIRTGDSETFFIEPELGLFRPTLNGRWLTLEVRGINGAFRLETKVALNRLPTPPSPPPPID